MALDFSDQLTAGKDLILVRSDKYRAYNLLRSRFVDNPGIGLDIAGMISLGMSDDQVEAMVTQYLIDFDCDLQGARIQAQNGAVSISYDFGGSYVQS